MIVYGNGGLVGWDKQTCPICTHENAQDKKAEIDFCWTVQHENLHNCYPNKCDKHESSKPG